MSDIQTKGDLGNIIKDLVEKYSVETCTKFMSHNCKTIAIKKTDKKPIKIEGAYYKFELLLQLAEARIHPYLCGPAGSFKTSTVEKVAQALELPFVAQSVCAQTTKSDFLGFYNAHGTYMPTHFRNAYENGGVFLLDEIDLGNPNVLAVLNTALANNAMAFPDKTITRHDDFVLFAAANTFGHGGDITYIGRNALDGATLDRFAFVGFPYDESLEAAACGVHQDRENFDIKEGGILTHQKWHALVMRCRNNVKKHKLRHVISPRATFFGIKMIDRGIGAHHLQEMFLFKSADNATREKISGNSN